MITMQKLAGCLVLLIILNGCKSKSSRREAQSEAAYIMSQEALVASRAAKPLQLTVTIVGPVKHPLIQWVEGLTLPRAILAADYHGLHDPRAIVVTRQGEKFMIDTGDLLSGKDNLTLEPGDIVELLQ